MRCDVEELIKAGNKLEVALQQALAMASDVKVGLDTAVIIVDARQTWEKTKSKFV